MYGVELEYRVCEVNGYKCRHCGQHLGSIGDEEKMSDTGFEEWSFCPYCGAPLHDDLVLKERKTKMAKTNPMIYVPAKTCTIDEFSDKWEECQKANTERLREIEQKAIKNGGILHRFLYESVADGKAIYQIIKVNKKTVRVRLCCIDGCFSDYVVPQWGEEATINIEYAEAGIKWQDIWRNRKFN